MTEQQVEALATNLRVGPLTNIEPLLRSLGCEPQQVFESQGLKPHRFTDIDDRLPYHQAARLVAACVEASNCDHFGLLLGQWFLTSHLGTAGLLAETAPDVASALRDIIDNVDLHDRGGVVTMERYAQHTSFGYAINLPDIPAVEQILDFSITNICAIMRSLCGMSWRPLEVHLSRSEPPDSRRYQEFFRAPVAFDALESAIIFPNRWLEQPLATANREYHELLSVDARDQHTAMPMSMSARVRDVVRRNLPGGSITAAPVAASFGLHERTLNRRLREEGASFRQLLEAVRQLSSLQYLAGTALSIGDIAMALGYGSTDAFDHAFRRWFGQSPSGWRESQPVK